MVAKKDIKDETWLALSAQALKREHLSHQRQTKPLGTIINQGVESINPNAQPKTVGNEIFDSNVLIIGLCRFL